MRALLYLILFLPFALTADPLILKNKFKEAHRGDFIVTAQEKNYSLLFIHDLDQNTLVLEEIIIPEEQIDLKKMRWQEWLAKKAPGHTAWTVYEINLDTGALCEAFSYSQNGWLFLDNTHIFLAKLFTLPLTPVKTEERRKIGPAPQSGAIDTRAVWNPPLMRAGEKIGKTSFAVWKTRLPEDPTPLSGSTLELYFSTLDPSFPFPYWVEIQSPHYNFKLRAIDSGTGLRSFYPGPIPHRPES